jgi:hypothetical protein
MNRTEAISSADRPSPMPAYQRFLKDAQKTLPAPTENFILPSPPSRKRRISDGSKHVESICKKSAIKFLPAPPLSSLGQLTSSTSNTNTVPSSSASAGHNGGVGTITLGYGRQLRSLIQKKSRRETLTSNVSIEKPDNKATIGVNSSNSDKSERRANDQEDDVIVIVIDTDDDVVVTDDDDDDGDEVEDVAAQQLDLNLAGEEVEEEEEEEESSSQIDGDDNNSTSTATTADAPAQEEQEEQQHHQEEEAPPGCPPPPVNPASPIVSPWLLHAKRTHQEQEQQQQQQQQDYAYGESVSMTYLLQSAFELDSFEDLSSCVAQCLQGNPNAVSKVTVASAMAECLVGRLRKRAAAKQNKNKQQPQPQPQLQPQQQKQKQRQQSKGKKPAETTVAIKKEVTKKDNKKKSTKPTVSWPGISAGAGAVDSSEKDKEKKILKEKSVTSLHKNKKYDGYYKAFKGFKKGAIVKH